MRFFDGFDSAGFSTLGPKPSVENPLHDKIPPGYFYVRANGGLGRELRHEFWSQSWWRLYSCLRKRYFLKRADIFVKIIITFVFRSILILFWLLVLNFCKFFDNLLEQQIFFTCLFPIHQLNWSIFKITQSYWWICFHSQHSFI